MNIKYIVFINSVGMCNSLVKYTYHCSYLANIFYNIQSHANSECIFFISGVSFIVCGRLYLRHLIENSCLVLKVCILSFTRLL